MKLLRNIILYLIALFVPVLFLPAVFGDSIGIPKLLVLVIGNVSLLLMWAYEVYRTGSLRWMNTYFDMPLLGLALAYVAGAVFASPNTKGSLLSPAGAGAMLMLVLFYMLVIQTKSLVRSTHHSVHTDSNTGKLPIAKFIALIRKSDNILMNGLVHGALVVALWNIVNVGMQLASFSFTYNISQVTLQFPLTQLSPIGDVITQLVFLLITLAYLLINLSNRSIFGYIQQTVLLLGVVGSGYVLTQTTPFPLLPLRQGWIIAIETFKNAPFFGVGPENFITAFTRYKSADINVTDYWNITFGLSSNLYLHLLTTVGVLGLGFYLLLVRRIYKSFKTGGLVGKNILRLLLGIALVQLIVPSGISLLFVELVLLSEYAMKTSAPATKIKLVKVTESIGDN